MEFFFQPEEGGFDCRSLVRGGIDCMVSYGRPTHAYTILKNLKERCPVALKRQMYLNALKIAKVPSAQGSNFGK